MLTNTVLFDQKYSKNSNIVNNLSQLVGVVEKRPTKE